MILNFFSSRGWQSWDVEHRLLIPEEMLVLIDDGLRLRGRSGCTASDGGREVKVNLAVCRTPKQHVTINYLEPDFTELFRKGLRGPAPDGSQDTGFHGRELTRNARVGTTLWQPGCDCRSSPSCRPGRSPPCSPGQPRFPSRSRCRPGSPGQEVSRHVDLLRGPGGLHGYLELERAATTRPLRVQGSD